MARAVTAARARRLPALAAGLLPLLPLLAQGAGPSAPFSPLPPAQAPARALPGAASAALGPAEAASAADATRTRLTGLRTGTRPQALIDGQWLAVGDRQGLAVLQAVDAQGAWLRHPDGRLERLALLGTDVQLQRHGRSAPPPPAPPTRVARAATP